MYPALKKIFCVCSLYDIHRSSSTWLARLDLLVVAFHTTFIKCVAHESILYYVLNVIWSGTAIMNEADVLGILVNNIVHTWWWEATCTHALTLSFYHFDILSSNCAAATACKNILTLAVL